MLGEKTLTDEAMIKCMGRAIAWVQHNPRKPVKHGIKAFAMCCAHTGCLCSSEICTGKKADVDGSAKAVTCINYLWPLDWWVLWENATH